jgi:hypothetical protein
MNDAKPREMTLAAIRKRFDSGAWDHADCEWLYTKAEQHAEMAELLLQAYTHVSHGGPTRAEVEAVLKKVFPK